jgi:hypothetical protein
MVNLTHNTAITSIASPEQMLPVLISAEGKDRTGETSFGGVRRFVRADLDLCFRDRRQFESKYGRIDELQRERVRFAVRIGEAIASRNLPKLKQALVQLYGKKIGESSLPLFLEQPLRSLADSFNPALADTNLCVWWSSVAKRLLWGVQCRSIESALFVLALSAVGDIGSLGMCKRCRELFFRVRPSKKYCGDRCQAADAMARFRKNKKRATGKVKRQQ